MKEKASPPDIDHPRGPTNTQMNQHKRRSSLINFGKASSQQYARRLRFVQKLLGFRRQCGWQLACPTSASPCPQLTLKKFHIRAIYAICPTKFRPQNPRPSNNHSAMVEAELEDLEVMMAEGAVWSSPPALGYSEICTAQGELQGARYDALSWEESRTIAKRLKAALRPRGRRSDRKGWQAVIKPARVNQSERLVGAAREFTQRWEEAHSWVAGRKWGLFADEGVAGGACYRTGHEGKVNCPEPHDGHWRRMSNPFNITWEGLLNYKLLSPFCQACRQVILPKLSDIVYTHDPDLWKRLTEVWVWRRLQYRSLYATWPEADYGPISTTCAIHTGGAYLPHVDINNHPKLLNFIIPLRGGVTGWTGCNLLATASRVCIPLNGLQILWFNSSNICHCSLPMILGHPNS